MDIKNISTFIQVAELCSFTKAAENLGYSQSTVSFQIRQLEQELGVKLLERINHTVSLTAEGRRFLKAAHEIQALLRGFHSDVHASEISGRVRLATADSLCHVVISKIFPALHRQFPGITLEIIPADTEEMFRLLNQNQVDLVYTLDSHFYDTSYDVLHEQQLDAHFIAGKTHTLGMCAAQKSFALEELVDESFLLTEKGMSYRRLMDEQMARHSLEIRPVLISGNTSLICELVAAGTGVAYLPDFVVSDHSASAEIVRLDVPEMKVEIWSQLLCRKDKWMDSALKKVVEALQNYRI